MGDKLNLVVFVVFISAILAAFLLSSNFELQKTNLTVLIADEKPTLKEASPIENKNNAEKTTETSSALSAEDTSTSENNSIGMANPATIYCGDLGYSWRINETETGQEGICTFTDGTECEEWQFLMGKCGQQFSYCTKNGYDLIVKTDGKNGVSPEYAVCVDKIGREIGSVTDLADLSQRSVGCNAKSETAATNQAPIIKGLNNA